MRYYGANGSEITSSRIHRFKMFPVMTPIRTQQLAESAAIGGRIVICQTHRPWLTFTPSLTHYWVGECEMLRLVEIAALVLVGGYAATDVTLRYFFPPESP
jgi:hypothetical protein